MTWNQAFSDFVNDDLLKAAVVLIALDVVFGVIAACLDKAQRFRFDKVAKFLLDDVLGKVLPWFVLFAAAKFAPTLGVDFGVFKLDLETIQVGAWALASAALVASLLQSLGQLGINQVSRAVDAVPGLSTGEGAEVDSG